MIITEIMRAMKAGEEVGNPAAWKDVQKTTNNVYVILVTVVSLLRFKYPNAVIPDDVLLGVAGVVTGLLGLFNTIVTAISTKKIGLF